MKLYISPHPTEYKEDGRGSGGIWRIIRAQAEHLSKHGVRIVKKPEKADIVAIHAGALIDTDKPIVAHNHGMYWTGDFEWRRQYWQYNNIVIETLRRAHAITTPSEWVAYPIKRDMRIIPCVIPHGVDLELLEPARESERFVLWAKPRVDVVSDPKPVNMLADKARNVKFVSTFGRPTQNVTVIGAMPHHKFLGMMRKASVWLATTRETGDIASREAMAMAIPVLGWNHGATAELVIHKETGYLAEVNDYDDLMRGLNFCINNRGALGKNGRQLVKEQYQWKDIMGQYASLYQEVLNGNKYPVKISVIVPAHNYAHFLPDCLRSLAAQTEQDFEVIAVNDGSTDNTLEVLDNLQRELSLDLKVVNQNNQGLCGALNAGRDAAKGKYWINLDADNQLAPRTLELFSKALDARPDLDVVGGDLGALMADGTYKHAADWPFGTINVHHQLEHINQLHSSSMARARTIERIGGYRHRIMRNEDGEYWCRAMSAGLRFEHVVNEPTLIYRWHEGNKSKKEGGEHDPEGPLSWNFYFPHKDNMNIVPFGMTGNPPKGSWAVRSYANPHITVVIPVGPDHAQYLPDALDSLAGQTFQNFECVVCNDTGKSLDVAKMGHPWVRIVNGPQKGPGAARNTAIYAAKAPLIVPLDADDLMFPDALRKMYLVWLDYPESLVYMDCYTEDKPEHLNYYRSGSWSLGKIKREAIYQVTILYPKQWWEAVGGYPVPGEDIPDDLGFEDWLFGVKLHLAGRDAAYINEPWGIYRHWTGYGQNRKDNEGQGTPEFREKLNRYYSWIGEKEREMAGCCGGRRPVGREVGNLSRPVMAKVSGEDVVIIYKGDRTGGFGLNYKFDRAKKIQVYPNEPFAVPAAEVGWILGMDGFVRAEEVLGGAGEEPPLEPPSVPTIEAPLGPPKLYPDEPITITEPMPTGAPPSVEAQLPPIEPSPGKMLSMLPSIDIDELQSLTPIMKVRLKEAGLAKVSDLAFDIEKGAHHILSVKGIKRVRLEKIEEEIFE